jgi:hypothetical protein
MGRKQQEEVLQLAVSFFMLCVLQRTRQKALPPAQIEPVPEPAGMMDEHEFWRAWEGPARV